MYCWMLEPPSYCPNTNTFYKLPEAQPSDSGLAAYAVNISHRGFHNGTLKIPLLGNGSLGIAKDSVQKVRLLYSNTSSWSGVHTDTDYLLVIRTNESQLYGWQEQWDVDMLRRTGMICSSLILV